MPIAEDAFAAGLAAEIWDEPRFQADLAAITRCAVMQAMGRAESVDMDALGRLVRAAPTLALSGRHEIGEASYYIAATAYGLVAENYPGLSPLLSLVLGRRGNFPAIDLMIPKAERGLPPSLLAEALARRASNTIDVGGSARSLTDLQILVWRDLQAGRSVAVSAPTSAGKSYVFRTYIEVEMRRRANLAAVIVVPTRALINQVQDQLGKRLEALGGRVLSIPRVQTDQEKKGGLVCYVLTQERLEVLLDTSPEFSADLILVDEAQSVGDDGRGIVLQSVVDELLARKPQAQVLFTLPMSANAASLGRLFDVSSFVERQTQESPVGQKIVLLEVDTVKADTIHASVWQNDRALPIGDISVGTPLTTAQHRLAHLAFQFGRHAPSIVYAESQAQCETIADILTQLQSEDVERQASEVLVELSQFVKDHVHPQYSLAETVLAGVGFHYGYIPSLVRKEIENGFDEGALRFIVCTTTLLKGVNLPARNLFMLRPKVGNKHMPATDFWNLAGRAGRLGREFEGNVFLIDYGKWVPQPLKEERRTLVAPAMTRVIAQTEEFAAFVGGAAAPVGQKTMMENAFARLYRDQRTGRLESTLRRLDLPARQKQAVSDAVVRASSEIELPLELLGANPWVSPRRQADLLGWARKKLSTKGDVADLIPPHPFAEDAYKRLGDMLRRCHRELEQRKDRSFLYFANLGLSWMRGKTIPNIIDDVAAYKDRRDEEYELPKLIRSVLGDIEKNLRFRYVRLTACYNSVVKFALVEAGHEEMVPHIPAIPLYLEMGASSESMLSFMELGLSRITARLLQDRAARPNMDSSQAKRWLERNRRIASQLPLACRREIDSLL